MNDLLLGGEISAAVVAAAGIAAVAIPRSRAAIARALGPMLGSAYQKQVVKQFKASFPELYAKFSGLNLGPQSQTALQAAMMRIPPQEALKLQGEFLRSKDWLLSRHSELDAFVAVMSSQDPKAQVKTLQDVFKLPGPKRQAIEKDVLSAYDRLAGRFPKWVNLLEATLRNPGPTKVLEPAGKR